MNQDELDDRPVVETSATRITPAVRILNTGSPASSLVFGRGSWLTL